ncbi:hypothetical protein ACLK2I_09445 [Escherichia coli]
MNGEDKRLLVIIGPCYDRQISPLRWGLHHPSAVAARPVPVTAGNGNAHLFEKRRTVVAGKGGFISDPDLNGSYRVNHGLELARKLLLQVNELGRPYRD